MILQTKSGGGVGVCSGVDGSRVGMMGWVGVVWGMGV